MILHENKKKNKTVLQNFAKYHPDAQTAFNRGDIAMGEDLSRQFQEVSLQLEQLTADWLAAQEALEQG